MSCFESAGSSSLKGMNQYLTTSDVARLLGYSNENIRVLERAGKLRAIRTKSGIRLFAQTDIESFAAEREQQRQKRATSASVNGR
ncbi:MAG: helix-turn-helix domain-containing protein [Acidobacteriota bacterium]